MKQRLNSLQLRILLPVIGMTLFVVILMTTLFTRAYTDMVLTQEREINAAGFDTVSRSVAPLITSSVSEVRSLLLEERVAACARNEFSSKAAKIKAQRSCADYLQSALSRSERISGVFFLRQDGSMFGAVPQGNFFHDRAEDGPLPGEIRQQVLSVPMGQIVWIGPLSEQEIYGYENGSMPQGIMAAAWRSVGVSYGECYSLMLMDGSVFDRLFASLQDGNSTWRLFTADQTEFYRSGAEACSDPAAMIANSNSFRIYRDENGRFVCSFSMTLASPDWILTREVDMEDYDQVVRNVRRIVWITAGAVFLIALILFYLMWLRGFMRQFHTLLQGITHMGQSDSEPIPGEPFRIGEFQNMQQEINKTSLALNRQMDTIRRMEREQMELENRKKEQERIVQELHMAREIQLSSLPHIFPPFPDRKEIDLFASMDPARDVGGDFYDFYFIDEDHLCLLIADVSGKGIPAALFMMAAKRILEEYARQGCTAGEILEKTNEAILKSNQAEMFVTVWLGILEISTGKMTCANAGHEYPALCSQGVRFELYRDRHGFVIGGMSGVRYREYSLQLAPGDKLFVYTDGVPEATSGSGEMFGTERMIAALNDCAGKTPDEILRQVKSSVDAFADDAEQFDDLTMMCLEYRGPQAGKQTEDPALQMNNEY